MENAAMEQKLLSKHLFGLRREQPQPWSVGALDAFATPPIHFRHGQVICGDEAGSPCWYRIVGGVARRSLIRLSGRRQIVGLLLPGDFFGFPSRSQTFAIEAVGDDTIVRSYPRQRLEALARTDPGVAQGIRELSLEMIFSLEEQVLILGRTTAIKKVGSFLISLARRLATDRAGWVVLPLSRYDIADYLGLSVETVSRALSDLKRSGAIVLAGTRQLRIVDPDAIEDGAVGGAVPQLSPAASLRSRDLGMTPQISFPQFNLRPHPTIGDHYRPRR
jgi:CRP/FNR family nitrogen fixation transcriptional regulator